jgi:hypothetical protein
LLDLGGLRKGQVREALKVAGLGTSWWFFSVWRTDGSFWSDLLGGFDYESKADR